MEEYVRPAPPPCELEPWLAVSYCCDVGDDTDVGGPDVADSYREREDEAGRRLLAADMYRDEDDTGLEAA